MAWNSRGSVIPGISVQFWFAMVFADYSRATLRFTPSSTLRIAQTYDLCLDVGSGSGLWWFTKVRMEPGYKGVVYVDTPATFPPFTTAKLGVVSPPVVDKVVGLLLENWV